MTACASGGVTRRAFLWALTAAVWARGRREIPFKPLRDAAVGRMSRWAG